MGGYNFALLSDLQRVKRALNQLERQYANDRLHRRRPSRSPVRHGMIPIYNGGSDEIPAYGICRILTGAPALPNARRATNVGKPDTYGARLDSHLINGPIPISAGEHGWAQPYPPYTVLYDTAATPAFGESWGPINASYKATKRSAGYRVNGILSSTNATMHVMPNHFILGKGRLDGDLASGGSATVSVYDENGDTTYNITVFDADEAMIATGDELVAGIDIIFGWLPTHREYHLINADTCPTTA